MKRTAWLAGVAALLLLSGCNPDSGSAFLEVVYPSGCARTYTTYDEMTSVEETDYQLRAQEAEDYDKTYEYNLQILDGNGNLLWELPDIGRPTMRGGNCRDIRDWETGQVIYTFDYAVEPDIASYKDSMLKVRFIWDDDSIPEAI